MNEILRKYIDETFDKNLWNIRNLNSFIVVLTDKTGSEMSLMNLGNDIFVYIDNELYETISYRYNHLSKKYDWEVRR